MRRGARQPLWDWTVDPCIWRPRCRKPGVALFGPTDPARNGPYGGSIAVIRPERVVTTYRRDNTIHPSMAAISADRVVDALLQSMSLPTQHPIAAEHPL